MLLDKPLTVTDDGVRFPDDYRSLDVIRDVYLGKVAPPPWQFKAAIAALKHEFPQLQATAHLDGGGVGDRLDKAWERSRAVMQGREDGRVIEGTAVEETVPKLRRRA